MDEKHIDLYQLVACAIFRIVRKRLRLSFSCHFGRFLMFLFKKVPLKRPSAEECYEHRWLTQSDFMNKKRERAVFLGNRLKVTPTGISSFGKNALEMHREQA